MDLLFRSPGCSVLEKLSFDEEFPCGGPAELFLSLSQFSFIERSTGGNKWHSAKKWGTPWKKAAHLLHARATHWEQQFARNRNVLLNLPSYRALQAGRLRSIPVCAHNKGLAWSHRIFALWCTRLVIINVWLGNRSKTSLFLT